MSRYMFGFLSESDAVVNGTGYWLNVYGEEVEVSFARPTPDTTGLPDDAVPVGRVTRKLRDARPGKSKKTRKPIRLIEYKKAQQVDVGDLSF